MDQRLRLSEEHRGSDSHGDSDLSPVVRRYEKTDLERLCQIFWEYYLVVAGDDLSAPVVVSLEDEKITMPRVEVMVNWYLAAGYEVVLVEEDGRIVGFAIFMCVFDCLMIVRGLYLSPEIRGDGLMKAMFSEACLGRPIQKLIFQTLSNRPPSRLLDATEGRRTMLNDDGRLITWEMRWQNAQS